MTRSHRQAFTGPFLLTAIVAAGCVKLEDRDAVVAKYCDEQGKYLIYAQVSAEGVAFDGKEGIRDYFGGDAPILFSLTGMRFVEFPSTNDEFRRRTGERYFGAEQYSRLTSARFVRAFLAKADDPNCLQWQPSQRPPENSALTERNLCVAAIPIDQPSARYRATSTTVATGTEGVDSQRIELVDTQTGKLVAEAVDFSAQIGYGTTGGLATCRYTTKFRGKDFSSFGLVRAAISNPDSEARGVLGRH